MSLGPISRAAETFERNAPRACLFGMRVCVVALLIAAGGLAIAALVNVDLGYWVVVVGVTAGLIGMAIYFKGYFLDRKDPAP